jgi:threonine dehydrogenase-like Zn-dependent dehydrogenase
MAAQLFRIRGARVMGADLLAFRRGLAQEAGIDYLINPQQQDLVSAIREATAGEGARTVVEATGNPELINPALEATCKLGEVILLGSPRGKATIDVYNLIHRKGISLKGTHETLVPRQPNASEPNQHSVSAIMMSYLQTGELKVGHLISEVVRPDEAEKGFKALLSEQDKTMAVLTDWRNQ